MKLQRTLFYVMLGILVIAIITIVCVPADSVWSRIATGFMTGSLIGMTSALVNFIHQKQIYFDQLMDVLLQITNKMRDYAREADFYNRWLSTHPKEENIQDADKESEDEEKVQQKMQEECERLFNQIDFEAYQPFFFWHPMRSILDQLEDELREDFLHLYGERMMCRTLSALAVPSSREEQMMVLGDPDKFYDDTIQRNKDYYDLINWSRYQLSIILSKMSPYFKVRVSKHAKTLLKYALITVMFQVDKSTLRDVHAERDAEIEEERETENGK